MENIRSIKEKIRSCISCDENQCRVMKERLDHHVQSHHSSFRRTVSSQLITPHPKCSRAIYTSRSDSTSTKTDGQTSTSDIDVDKEREEVNNSNYERDLRVIIEDFLRNLPERANKNNGIVEQNVINEFIERIRRVSKISDDTNNSNDVRLDAEVDDFLHSIPIENNKGNEIQVDNLKTKLARNISNLNDKNKYDRTKQDYDITSSKQNIDLKNTTILSNDTPNFKYNKKDAMVQNYTTNLVNDNKNHSKQANLSESNIIKNRSVDTQVSNIFDTIVYDNVEEPTFLNKQNKVNKYPINTGKDFESKIKKDIFNWLFQFSDEIRLSMTYSDVQAVTIEVYERLLSLIDTNDSLMNNKKIIKEELIKIINRYFNITLSNSDANKINQYVDHLTTLLLEINSNEYYSQNYNTYLINRCEKNVEVNRELEELKTFLYKTVVMKLDNYNTNYNLDVIEDIIKLVSENLYSTHGDQLRINLFKLLKTVTDISDFNADDIANLIVNIINSTANGLINNSCDSIDNIKNHNFGNIISVFKSEHDLIHPSNKPGTQTPKRKSSILKKTSKINPEEQVYTNKLVGLMRTWIDTLPKKYNKSKDKKFKEIIVNKLLEDILDQVKLEQLAPETLNERNRYISFFVYRWLNRYEYFEDVNMAKPYVDELIEKITDIPVPQLIKPHGDIQESQQCINLEETLSTPQQSLSSNAMKILEDKISNWVNEQPLKTFQRNGQSGESEAIHKFVLKVYDIINQNSLEQLNKVIKEWLSTIIKPENKQKITMLAESLQSKIEKDMTIKSVDATSGQEEATLDKIHCYGGNNTDSYLLSDNVLKELISKYLELKYDSENHVARKVYVKIFKNELQKLNNLLNLNNNETRTPQERIASFENLSEELKYIQVVTNWLKNIPLEKSLNRTRNNVQVDSVMNLVKNLRNVEVDVDRLSLPLETEYKKHITIVMNNFADQLPVLSKFKNTLPAKVNDLVNQITSIKMTLFNHSKLQNVRNNNMNPDNNVTDYIEEYIRDNDEELFEDDLKLEACILRLFREINSVTNQNSANNKPVSHKPMDETIKKFSLEIKYAKEISDWLNNLPLLPLNNKPTLDQLVEMISNLAEKISEIENDSALSDYLINWISELPLAPNPEIVLPVAVQQIINRIKRINKVNKQDDETTMPAANVRSNIQSSGVCEYPQSCCNKTITCKGNRDPGTVIVEAIEEWCNNLPIQIENEDKCKTLKSNITTKLFQKLSELNMNPEYFNNDVLFQEMFSDEIDTQLQVISKSFKSEHFKMNVKKELMDVIIKQRNDIKKKTSGIEYKRNLENTIEISMPYSVPNNDRSSSAFKIYKDRLATIFILENFDYGNDSVKVNYVKKIKKEIDKYFNEIQDKTQSIDEDQIYKDLYSALSTVPSPNEAVLIEEIEEIKTRCEIDNWFETLPIREALGIIELLEINQILATLAKRVCSFEKYDKDCDNKIHKEITKWLVRLPLLDLQAKNIDSFANDLKHRLKSTISQRKCKQLKVNNSQQSIEDQDKSVLSTSKEIDLKSISNIGSPRPLPQCCRLSIQQPKKPVEMILEIVKTWCQQLPLPLNTPQDKDNLKLIKDNLAMTIIMKISEINMNPAIFNDEFLYEALLDNELESIMSKLPVSYEFIHSKNSRKKQLIESIKSVKTLLTEDNERYEYKLKIKNVVEETLKDSHKSENSILFDDLKDEIVDNFIIYNFNKQSDENNWKYKTLVHDTVEKYYTLIETDNEETLKSDLLMKGNQLLCELNKVPLPSNRVILEEVQEIQIKNELTKLLNEISIIEDKEKVTLKHQIKVTLTKQLYNSLKATDELDNDSIIKEDIIQNLRKLGETIDPEKIDKFIRRLKYLMSNNGNNNEQSSAYKSGKEISMINKKVNISSQETKDEQWMSLLPVTPKFMNSNYEEHGYQELRNAAGNIESSQEHRNFLDQPSTEPNVNYESFEKGALLSSSIRKDSDAAKISNVHEQGSATASNQNSYNPSSTNKTIVRSPVETHKKLNNQTTKFHSSKSLLPESEKIQISHHSMNDSRNGQTIEQSLRGLEQNRIDQANQTEQSDVTQIQSPRSLKTPNVQQKQPETPISNLSTSELTNSQIVANQLPTNTQDAYTQEAEYSKPQTRRSDINELPFPYRNRPFIPSRSTPSTEYKPNFHSCSRGQPCRRPSITIFNPTRNDESGQIPSIQCTKEQETESELEPCTCFNKRNRPNVCSEHMRRHCRICNEINPFYCQMPPYRYPSFYYH